MSLYKTRKQRKHNADPAYAMQVAHRLLRQSDFGFLISHQSSGWASCRFVQPIVEMEGNTFRLWVGTRVSSRKIAEIRANPQVTFAFGNQRQMANLVLYGIARIETDPQVSQKYWKPTWKMFFPEGTGAESYACICIEPQRMELLSFHANITPEPFGLIPLALAYQNAEWQVIPHE